MDRTPQELQEIGEKVVADRKDRAEYNQVRRSAIKRLIAKYPEDFSTFFGEARKELGYPN